MQCKIPEVMLPLPHMFGAGEGNRTLMRLASAGLEGRCPANGPLPLRSQSMFIFTEDWAPRETEILPDFHAVIVQREDQTLYALRRHESVKLAPH